MHGRDKGKVADELIKAGFKSTILGSTGGFLREGNTTFLVGVEDEELDHLKAVFEQNCQSREQVVNMMPYETTQPGAFVAAPVKVPVGGAVLFVMNVDQFHRF